MRICTWRRAVAILAVGVVLPLSLVACGTSRASSGFDGAELAKPVTLPEGTFTDTSGATYDLRARATGHLTLVYFGYTNCPDVCPTTMADIGAALRSLPAATQKDVQVVFVTSDPDRDTGPVMKSWLANFDDGVANPFVGLRTDYDDTQAYGAKIGVPLEPPTKNADGTISVTHGSQVYAFGPNGQSTLVWLDGTKPSEYAHDIGKLAAPA